MLRAEIKLEAEVILSIPLTVEVEFEDGDSSQDIYDLAVTQAIDECRGSWTAALASAVNQACSSPEFEDSIDWYVRGRKTIDSSDNSPEKGK